MQRMQQLPTSEIKAFFKLARKYGEIELNDTPYVKEIKSLLKDIAYAFETNDVTLMSRCNHLAARNYGYVVKNNRNRYCREVSIEVMGSLGVDMTISQLKLFAEGLIDEIKACKARERNAAFNSMVGEYMCDKVIDALTSHRASLFFPNFNPYPQKL